MREREGEAKLPIGLTEHFANLASQNPAIDEFYAAQKRPMASFVVPNQLNVRSGEALGS